MTTKKARSPKCARPPVARFPRKWGLQPLPQFKRQPIPGSGPLTPTAKSSDLSATRSRSLHRLMFVTELALVVDGQMRVAAFLRANSTLLECPGWPPSAGNWGSSYVITHTQANSSVNPSIPFPR